MTRDEESDEDDSFLRSFRRHRASSCRSRTEISVLCSLKSPKRRVSRKVKTRSTKSVPPKRRVRKSKLLHATSARLKKNKPTAFNIRSSDKEVVKLVQKLKIESNQMKMEHKRQRNHLRLLKEDRDNFKKKSLMMESKQKQQLRETTFWINKAESALKKVRELKDVIKMVRKSTKCDLKVKEKAKSRADKLDDKLMKPLLDSKIIKRKMYTEQKATQTYFDENSQLIEMRKEMKDREQRLEQTLDRSFRNYEALKKTHERALRQLRREKQEKSYSKQNSNEHSQELEQERRRNLDLQRQISVLQLRNKLIPTQQSIKSTNVDSVNSSEPESENMIESQGNQGLEEIIQRNSASNINTLPNTILQGPKRKYHTQSKLLRFSHVSEPLDNLKAFDKVRKLRSMYNR